MKKILKISIFLILVLFCLSACRTPAEWQKSDEIERGIYAVEVIKDEESNLTWYATVDTKTKTVLSINLIYSQEIGEPKETKCLLGEKEISITKSKGERQNGGILFFTLPYDYMVGDCDSEIEIIQTFQNGQESIFYRPSDIFATFNEN